MIAKYIQKDARAIFGSTDDDFLFRQITDAVEMLSNKGNFDANIVYLNIGFTNGQFVLPDFIETPLALYDLGTGKRALFRDRLWEFAVNNPAENLGRPIAFEYSDVNDQPLQVMPVYPTRLRVDVPSPGVRVTGLDQNGNRISGITLQTFYGGPSWSRVLSIDKDPGVKNQLVRVYAETPDGSPSQTPDLLMATFQPDVVDPKFRVLTLPPNNGATGTAFPGCRLIARRRNFEILCWDDYIPIDNRMALKAALRGVRLIGLENPDIEKAQALFDQAEAWATEEQTSRNSAKALADAGNQIVGDANVQYLSTGLILVSDVYKDACAIFGQLGRESILDAIFESEQTLGRTGQWDSLLGFADVNPVVIEETGCHRALVLVLPSWIENVISITECGRPMVGRSNWIHFHLNGPGARTYHNTFDWMEDSPVQVQPVTPNNLLLMADPMGYANTTGAATPIYGGRVFGRDAYGQPVIANDGHEGIPLIVYPYNINATFDDLPVPPQELSNGATAEGLQAQPGEAWIGQQFAIIDRISTPGVNGTFTLFVSPPTFKATDSLFIPILPGTTLAVGSSVASWNGTDESVLYRRLRVPWGTRTGALTVAFRRRQRRAMSLNDFIFLRSKTALVEQMRALKLMSGVTPDYSNGAIAEARAKKLLGDEMMSRRPTEPMPTQYLDPVINTFRPIY
jgi:hypothetical protein